MQGIAVVITLLGIYCGYALYRQGSVVVDQMKQSEFVMSLRNFFYKGWAFDDLYHVMFVRPFQFITQLNRADVFDRINTSIATGSRQMNRWLSVSQNGSLRWYVAGVLIGVIVLFTLQLFS